MLLNFLDRLINHVLCETGNELICDWSFKRDKPTIIVLNASFFFVL